MFEIEDLFGLTIDGAFSSLEEFKSFAKEVDTSTLFSVITPGAFKDLQEFESSLTEKKKSSRYSFKWSRGSYGIYYRDSNRTWLFGFFAGKR